MLLSECPHEGDTTVFVLLGCGTPLQMTSLGRWSGLQSRRVWQRRQAREEGSGTFAHSCIWDFYSWLGPCPSLGTAGQPVYLVTNTSACQEEPSALCSGQTLQPLEGGDTKTISSPSPLLCGCVWSRSSDDRGGIENPGGQLCSELSACQPGRVDTLRLAASARRGRALTLCRASIYNFPR